MRKIIYSLVVLFIILLLIWFIKPIRYKVVGLGYKIGLLQCPKELHEEIISFDSYEKKSVPSYVIVDNCKGKTTFF